MMTEIHYYGPFELTIFDGGSCCNLWKNGLSLFWNGEAAVEIVDRFHAHGLTALTDIWEQNEAMARPEV